MQKSLNKKNKTLLEDRMPKIIKIIKTIKTIKTINEDSIKTTATTERNNSITETTETTAINASEYIYKNRHSCLFGDVLMKTYLFHLTPFLTKSGLWFWMHLRSLSAKCDLLV